MNSDFKTTGQDMDGAKKKKLPTAIAVGLVAALIIGGTAFAYIGKSVFSSKKPADVVFNALGMMVSPNDENPMEELLGFEELNKSYQKEATSVDTTLTLEKIAPLAEGLSALEGSRMTINSSLDRESKVVFGSLGLKIGGTDLDKVDVYLDKEKVLIGMPYYTQKVFSLNYNDDFASKESTSFLMSSMDITAEYLTEISTATKTSYDNMFNSNSDTGAFDVVKLADRYIKATKAIEELKGSMEITKLDDKPFTINGKGESCKGFDVVVPKAAMIKFIDVTGKFFLEDEEFKSQFIQAFSTSMKSSLVMNGGYAPADADAYVENMISDLNGNFEKLLLILEESLNDVEIKLYVDKKGSPVSFVMKTSVIYEGSNMEFVFDMNFLGGTYLYQNYNGNLSITVDGVIAEIMFEQEETFENKKLASKFGISIVLDGAEMLTGTLKGNYDDNTKAFDFDCSFASNGTGDASIVGNGIFTDLKKGKSFAMDIEKIEVIAMGTQICELSMQYGVQPLEESAKVLEGEPLDIVTASEEDWTAVMMEFQVVAMPLLEELSAILY